MLLIKGFMRVIFYTLVTYYFLMYFGFVNVVPETHHGLISQIIENDPGIFSHIQIDEYNGYAYFFTNTTRLNDLNNDQFQPTKTKVSISKNIDYESKLNELYSQKNKTDVSIIYKTDKTMANYFFEIMFALGTLYLFFTLIRKFIMKENIIDNPFTAQNREFTVVTNEKTKFDDVIGLQTVKSDLKEYIGIFKNRKKYLDNGCELPRGLIFSGKPGTGKTLLGKALAGESNVSFIYACGSDFMEMYVGVGSQRVRKLFQLAREFSPAIIFIDELDSIGKSRNGKHFSHGEQDNTLNSLLSEMDGMKENENILVIAATNLIGTLDSALTRSGRFDKKVVFDIPNKTERQDMFKLYMNKIKLSDAVSNDMENTTLKLASMTAGLTGADIKTITNHAIMSYVKRSNNTTSDISSVPNIFNNEGNDTDNGTKFNDMEEAIAEVSVGMVKRERTMTDDEKKIVAHHEAGHAIVAYMLKQCQPPIKVSIIPRGEAALGYSQQEPTDQKLHSKEELFARMCVLLGGRIAENISFNKITTGASDDIEKLTKIAYGMVTVYGMNNAIGELNIMDNDSPYKDMVSQKTKETIDHEVNKLINRAKTVTDKMIDNNKTSLNKIANYLIENEEITKYDFETIFPENDIEDTLDIESYMKDL